MASPISSVSIVIPVYNESESVASLHEALTRALHQHPTSLLPAEIIYVDDGSTDRSADRLRDIASRDPRVAIVRLWKNFGKAAALMAGFSRVKNDLVLVLDADLQNDPSDIPAFISKINEGYDVVSGWRQERQDALVRRRVPSRIANALIARVSGLPLHDYGCAFKAYRRTVIGTIRLYGEMHRFIPIFAAAAGARVAEIPVSHHPRRFGVAKFGSLWRSVEVVLDLITVTFLTRYLTRPMYVFGGMGLLTSLAGTAAIVIAVALKLLGLKDFVQTPLPTIAAFSFLATLQFFLMGLLGELLARTYFESQHKESYTIKEIIRGEFLAGGDQPTVRVV